MKRILIGLLVLFGTMGLGIFLGTIASRGTGMAGLGVAFLFAGLSPLLYFIIVVSVYKENDRKSNIYLFAWIIIFLIAETLWALFGSK